MRRRRCRGLHAALTQLPVLHSQFSRTPPTSSDLRDRVEHPYGDPPDLRAAAGCRRSAGGGRPHPPPLLRLNPAPVRASRVCPPGTRESSRAEAATRAARRDGGSCVSPAVVGRTPPPSLSPCCPCFRHLSHLCPRPLAPCYPRPPPLWTAPRTRTSKPRTTWSSPAVSALPARPPARPAAHACTLVLFVFLVQLLQ